MHVAPSLAVPDLVGPLVAALVFVAGMALVREPARRDVNAILVAGAAGAYLGGGLGVWELAGPIVVGTLAYFGLRSYRAIGIGWLAHAGWDVVHHLYGNPIWPFMPTSSFGCAIFDSAIAVWFLAGAPSLRRAQLT
jgi:hypothetical protein